MFSNFNKYASDTYGKERSFVNLHMKRWKMYLKCLEDDQRDLGLIMHWGAKHSVCLSVCLSARLSVSLSVLLSVSLSLCPSVRFSISLSVRLSVRLSVSLFVYLSVCPSTCLSIY